MKNVDTVESERLPKKKRDTERAIKEVENARLKFKAAHVNNPVLQEMIEENELKKSH